MDRSEAASATLRISAGLAGLVATAELWRVRENLESLPSLPRASGVAALWVAYAAVGLAIGGAFGLLVQGIERRGSLPRLLRVWPPAMVGGILAGLTLMTAPEVPGSLRIVAGMVSCLAAFGLLEALSRAIAVCRRPLGWSLANALFTGALLVALWKSDPGGAVGKPGLLVAGLLAIQLGFVASDLAPRRRLAIGSVALLPFGVLAAAGSWPAPAADGHAPNLIFITIDTLRADFVGAYGGRDARTPNIDALAEAGVVFDNAFSPVPLTNPSHTTIFTGLYPGNHGVKLNRATPLAPGISSLPAKLRQHGYHTAAFVSAFVLTREMSMLHESFDIYDDDFSPLPLAPDPVWQAGLARAAVRALQQTPAPERIASHTVDRALAWVEAESSRPFALWVHLYDPHGPYQPPIAEDLAEGIADDLRAGGDWYSLSPEERESVISDPEAQARLKRLYAAEVSFSDRQVGRFLSRLEDLGLLDDSLIVLTSDHGESLTEHRYYFDHSVCLYEPSIHVPLILRFPHEEFAGRRVRDLVGLQDIAPTVLEWLAIESGDPSDGRSMLASVAGTSTEEAPRVIVSAVFPGQVAGGKTRLSVRTRESKLIWTSAWWADLRWMPESLELFDLRSDPGERVNRARDLPGRVDELRSSLELLKTSWLDPGSQEAPLSEEERGALRTLGYLE